MAIKRCVGRAGRSGEAGFTMIEMIVMVGVIAVLASIAVPLVTVMEDRARGKATLAEMESLEEALLAWYDDFGGFPAEHVTVLTGPEATRARILADCGSYTGPSSCRAGRL